MWSSEFKKKIVELAFEAVQISSDSWWSFGNSNYVSSRSHMPCSAASSLSKLRFGCRSDKIIDTRRPPRRVCATRCMHCSSATKLALIYRITSTNVRQSDNRLGRLGLAPDSGGWLLCAISPSERHGPVLPLSVSVVFYADRRQGRRRSRPPRSTPSGPVRTLTPFSHRVHQRSTNTRTHTHTHTDKGRGLVQLMAYQTSFWNIIFRAAYQSGFSGWRISRVGGEGAGNEESSGNEEMTPLALCVLVGVDQPEPCTQGWLTTDLNDLGDHQRRSN